MAIGAIPVIFAGRRPMPDMIRIGLREDNEVEAIRFALPAIGSGQKAYLYMTLPGGGGDVADITGGMLTITRTHTASPGVIDAHVEIVSGAVSWHSEPMRLIVADTTRGGEQVMQAYPSAIADALARANAAAWRAESATGAGAPPIIPEATGTPIVATDSADRPLRGLTVYGKTTQDGTPSEDAPVDPMGTGTASPLRIVTAGGNLAALTPRLEDNFGITSSYDAQTGVVTVTGTATALAFVSYWLREPIPAGVPLVIGMGNGSSDSNITIRAQSASENANTTIATISSTNTVVKVTLTHAFEFLSIRVNAGATVNMKLQIGVTVGSDSAGYTWTHPDDPTSAQIIIPGFHFAVGGLLHGVPAISGGNYTDGRQWIADTVEYDAQTGMAQLVQRVASVTYFGGADENWVKGGSGSYFAIRRADKSSASNGLCTHYPGLAINAGEYKVGFSAATDKEYIRFRPTGYADMTVDQWRARLDASPVTVLYALAEPVKTPITGDELAALAQMRSRYPATTIYNDAGAQMAARYVADTKKYVDQRIEQLTNAVVSTGANI